MGTKKVVTLLGAAGLLVLVPGQAGAWGGDGHRYVNEAAVENLPAAMFNDGSGNAFNDRRAELIGNSTLPDVIKSRDGTEGPRHYCDADLLMDQYPYPFDTMPRDYAGYVSAFGRSNGVVQWEGFQDHYDGLVVAFRMRNWEAVYRAAADLGHYVADINQPFHCTANYDGQFTGNNGIHSRHESSLVSRKIRFSDLKTRRSNPPLVVEFEYRDNPVEAAFDALRGAFPLVAQILAADDVAAALDPSYGTIYYNSLFAAVGDQTIERLTEGGRILADLWYSAWLDAGRPGFGEVLELKAGFSNPVIDGDLGDLAGPGHLQTNTTDWGDNDSEIDQVFVNLTPDGVVFGLAGNLGLDEAMVLFLDTKPGGKSWFLGSHGVDYLNFASTVQLDTELLADFILSVRRTSTDRYDVNLYDVSAGTSQQLGSSTQSAFSLSDGGRFAIDNSNSGGVTSRYGNRIVDAENVRTGIELRVTRVTLGVAGGGPLGLVVVLSNGSAPIFSNQTIPGLPLGEFHGDVTEDLRSVGRALFTLPEQVSDGWLLY